MMVTVYKLLALLEYYCNRNIKVVNVHLVCSVIIGTTGMDWEGKKTTGMDWDGRRLLGWIGKGRRLLG